MAGGLGTVGVEAAAAIEARTIKIASLAWAKYAEARAMQFQVGRVGWALSQLPRLDGDLDGIRVAIEAAMNRAKLDHCTAFVAIPPSPLKLHLELTLEGLMAKLSKLFGAQDLVLGDDPFDGRFLVKATSEPAARALLTAPLRAELVALGVERVLYDDGSEHGHGGVVVIQLAGIVGTFETLDRALRLVTQFAKVKAA